MWQEHPDQLVGWFPRHVYTSASGRGTYLSKLDTLLWRRQYSMILTKGCILHSRYLEEYSLRMPKDVRDMVARRRNCEDIAMQFLVSSMTDDRPVFVWDSRSVLKCLGPPHGLRSFWRIIHIST
jgi:hypothetical protein